MSESVGRPAERTPERTPECTSTRPAAGTPARDGATAHAQTGAAAELARAHRRIAWLIALLLGLGCAGAVTSLVVQSRNGAAFDLHGWRDGSLGHKLDRAIDVPYARSLHRWQAAARYRLFGDLGQQVREGCPGWLFYADGLRAPVQAGHDPVERADGGDALTDARSASA
jgi:alginate O-acetyltransferase complex protein AlgJ